MLIHTTTTEPTPDITKITTAEIIVKTYVEYLTNGTKRDRYRGNAYRNKKQREKNTHKTKQQKDHTVR